MLYQQENGFLEKLQTPAQFQKTLIFTKSKLIQTLLPWLSPKKTLSML